MRDMRQSLISTRNCFRASKELGRDSIIVMVSMPQSPSTTVPSTTMPRELYSCSNSVPHWSASATAASATLVHATKCLQSERGRSSDMGQSCALPEGRAARQQHTASTAQCSVQCVIAQGANTSTRSKRELPSQTHGRFSVSRPISMNAL